ncbi:MAG: SurA N-terminal domain-containing protein [Bacteroidales bacterium]|nr:SurA N-terminal domain-containing protein [Bacteroidales bacterium]
MAVSIIIALALLSFILDPNTLSTAFNAMSSKNDVGKINGKTVSYTDFQEDIEKFSAINEIMTGSAAQNEQQQQQVRNIAWQSLVDKYLYIKNAEAAGIKVGDEELKDLLAGDMVSPLVSQNPLFYDENGTFSKAAVQEFVENIPYDESGRRKMLWDYIQNSVSTRQYYSKYSSLFTASNFQNPLMLKKAIEGNNVTTNVDFVLVPLPYMMNDSTVTVSDSEIQKYYNDHKKLFRQQASRDIEYVVFEVHPSESDIAEASSAVESVYNEFSTTENMKSFLARNSETSYSEYWYKAGELASINPEISDFVDANTTGVSPVTKDAQNVFYAARILATEQIPDSVFVKHILLQSTETAKADSLLGAASQKGADFSALAASYSLDTQSAAEGEAGAIGWMTQTYMIPGFESVMTAQVGKPFILKTQYGTHVVMVTAKTAPVEKKQVAVLKKTSIPGNETYNSYYSKASNFAKAAAGNYTDYLAAVDTMGLYSHPMANVLESNDTYGSIEQAKEVTRWVFDNKAGKASDVITVNNNYFFVATVKAVHKEGIATVKEATEVIRQKLYNEKLSASAAEKISAQIAGLTDLQTIADTLHTTVNAGVDVRFASMSGQGLDPKFIGAVSVAPEGQISAPLAGTIGTYIYKVNSRETGAFYTEDDAKNSAAQMNSYTSQMIVPVMMQDADVKDNRARFF